MSVSRLSIKKYARACLIFFILSPSFVYGEDNNSCSAQNLTNLMQNNLSLLNQKKLDITFGRAMGKADISAYYKDDDLKLIKARFKGKGGMADMNYYFLDQQNYLMEYHIVQNSNYYGQNDSVVLTDEKSYYHVCDQKLLSPAFGGIINDELYNNMKLVLDLILTESTGQ